MKYDEIHEDHADPLINQLHRAIKYAVKFLAILMVLVIFWTIADVVYVLYERLMETPFLLLDMEDILETFGAFLAVLIAIEIFTNIRLYLGTNVIPVQLVLATALMAVARKVIVLNLKFVNAEQIVGIALVTIALGVSYWLVREKSNKPG
ncbi:phosphate-starvation-inducible PsiE family protein [Microbulbifer sp. VAAF005]|uniref:phosphate-starvation-inducible PsiE family protein n=1 Tax=Microbulbifer sp. VAAF005 TaxID=3034230 RepID=UPI0024AC9303|nr:phosphate-starvation-inducible PsiE family protein [Microbulbifer sp. VAAF005]WHI47655.1 phosphate-starvation-inducible PsiE family protein [Microbulbifer sp. VAAF005]